MSKNPSTTTDWLVAVCGTANGSRFSAMVTVPRFASIDTTLREAVQKAKELQNLPGPVEITKVSMELTKGEKQIPIIPQVITAPASSR